MEREYYTLAMFIKKHDILRIIHMPKKERDLDIVINRQYEVFGFGSNTMSKKELALKHKTSQSLILTITTKYKDRIHRSLTSLDERINTKTIIKEVHSATIDRLVPSNEISIDALIGMIAPGTGARQRIINMCKTEGIKTVTHLLDNFSEGRLMKVPNFGRKSLNEMKAALAEMGLTLNKE